MPVRQKTFRIEEMIAPAAPRNAPAPDGGSATLQHHEILNELRSLRDLIEQRTAAPAPAKANGASESPASAKTDQMTASDLDTLKNETKSIHRAISRTMQELASLQFGAFSDAGQGRASRELDAVVNATERATQQILEAAEAIDEAANSLSASLKREQEQALANDIRDHVVRVFEACNFQDLCGQRIAKVLATLKFVEDRVARMLDIWGGPDAIADYTSAGLAHCSSEAKLMAGPKLDGDLGHLAQDEIDAMFV
jgi:chemotaxis protein CheZ